MSPSPHDVDDRRPPPLPTLALTPKIGTRSSARRAGDGAAACGATLLRWRPRPSRSARRTSPPATSPRRSPSSAAGLARGDRFQTLLGVTGSGKTFTMAQVIAKSARPALVIAHNKTLAAQLCNEFRELLPEAAVEYFVSYYDYYQPEAYIAATDTYIEKDSSINDEIDRLRHAATAALLARRDVVIVASVSCIYGLGSAEVYRDRVLTADRRRGDTRARRSSGAWWRRSTSATTRCSSAAASACAATPSRCSPPTPRRPTASRCSATRSRASPSTTRSPARCTATSSTWRSTRRRTTSPRPRRSTGRSGRSAPSSRSSCAASRPRASWSRPTACASAPSTTWR